MAAAERILARALDGLQGGALTIVDGRSERRYGQGASVARIVVNRPSFYRRVAFGGTVGAGESYMDGDWDCDELVPLVRLLAQERSVQDAVEGRRGALATAADKLRLQRRANRRRTARRNVEAHYDLGNGFFRLFLDDRMMYSAAVFDPACTPLEAASVAKLERLCCKLQLRPGDEVAEIGGGWGGFAVYAAERYDCRVTSISLSPAQVEYAKALVRERGLEDRVQVLLKDYRDMADMAGRFDKVVSVEMVEAVGHRYLPSYFRACGRLLNREGLFVLQAITIRDQRYRQALGEVDFIKKHIFPGGFIPSISVLASAAARNTNCVLIDLEDLGEDYAQTLCEWRTRLDARRAEALALGYDERLLRRFRFYFAYCEGGFRERALSDVQMVFAMPGYRGPTRRLREEPA